MRLSRWAVLIMGGAGLLGPAPLVAQVGGGGFSLGQPAHVDLADPRLQLRTIDEERLFRDSAFGRRVEAEILAASRDLEVENDALLAELTARELELTEARPTMDPAEFRAEADLFDQYAQNIRRAQAEKRIRLGQYEDNEQRRFFRLVIPVLQEVLQSSGAQILIDGRAVIIGVAGMDMTDDAIKAVDAALGDGSPSPTPLSLQ